MTSANNLTVDFAENKTTIRETLRRYNVFITLVSVLVLATALTKGLFISPNNLLNVGERASIIGLVALGQTMVIFTGGIDLSVGAMMSLALTLIGKTIESGASPGWGVLWAVLVCMFIGFINGYIISNTKIPPFMITLSTMLIVDSLALWITGAGALVYTKLQIAINNLFRLKGIGPRLFPTIIWVVFSLIYIFILARGKLGRNIFAVGGRERAAVLSGVKEKSVKTIVYIVSGLMSALAAVMLAYRIGGTNPDAGRPFQLESIAAVIIGGTNIMGGEGTVSGSMLGAMVMAMLVNLMNVMNVDPFIQDALKGLVLIWFVFIIKFLSGRDN